MHANSQVCPVAESGGLERIAQAGITDPGYSNARGLA
jgi:hypothetical protein